MRHAAFADGLPAALSPESGAALIMQFDAMRPAADLDASSGRVIRGVAAGRLPWVLGTASGSLSSDGHLSVQIRGLVLGGRSPVPVSLRGTNPFPAFRAIVSCLRAGADGTAAIANVSTGDFEASPDGHCDIDARVSLPQPCQALIVLIAGPSGTQTWIAVSVTS